MITKISGSVTPPQQHVSVEEELINKKLPAELLEQIFCLLDAASLKKAGCVCKLWNTNVVVIASHQGFSLIKGLVNFLCENLAKPYYANQSFSKEIALLNSVVEKNTFLNAKNLTQVNCNSGELINKISSLIQDLKPYHLSQFMGELKTEFKSFEGFFNLVYAQKIAKTLAMADSKEKSTELLYISFFLVDYGHIEDAIKCAEAIPMEVERHCTLIYIFDTLKKHEVHLERAIDVGNMFRDENTRSYALVEIAKILINKGEGLRGSQILQQIPEATRRTFVSYSNEGPPS